MYSYHHVVRRLSGFGITRLLLPFISRFPIAAALPVLSSSIATGEHGTPSDEPSFWMYLLVAAALVISGGAFAGLTIALMGQVSVSHLVLLRQS